MRRPLVRGGKKRCAEATEQGGGKLLENFHARLENLLKKQKELSREKRVKEKGPPLNDSRNLGGGFGPSALGEKEGLGAYKKRGSGMDPPGISNPGATAWSKNPVTKFKIALESARS